ncbi:MAG: hypothetical protein EKK57_07310 [Proteobacteria bacterium]|nr:MAG: hypothetical protein EKK57_07310 [Pseudomonadota bacterium]
MLNYELFDKIVEKLYLDPDRRKRFYYEELLNDNQIFITIRNTGFAEISMLILYDSKKLERRSILLYRTYGPNEPHSIPCTPLVRSLLTKIYYIINA